MALYTFYPCGRDGLATTFETRELPSDATAQQMAELILEDHASATSIVVWCGDRKVFSRERAPTSRRIPRWGRQPPEASA